MTAPSDPTALVAADTQELVERMAAESDPRSLAALICDALLKRDTLIAQQAATIEAVSKERDEAQAEITLTESLVADERRMRFAAEAERDRAREALKPFAQIAPMDVWDANDNDEAIAADPILSASDFYRARAALSTAKERGE